MRLSCVSESPRGGTRPRHVRGETRRGQIRRGRGLQPSQSQVSFCQGACVCACACVLSSEVITGCTPTDSPLSRCSDVCLVSSQEQCREAEPEQWAPASLPKERRDGKKAAKLPETPKTAEEMWQHSVIGDYLAKYRVSFISLSVSCCHGNQGGSSLMGCVLIERHQD